MWQGTLEIVVIGNTNSFRYLRNQTIHFSLHVRVMSRHTSCIALFLVTHRSEIIKNVYRTTNYLGYATGCNVCFPDCPDNACNHGECLVTRDPTIMYRCKCEPGYFGLRCNLYDPCYFTPCQNNGESILKCTVAVKWWRRWWDVRGGEGI